VKLPRTKSGPLKAIPGNYYYARIHRRIDIEPGIQEETIILMPNTMFRCEGILVWKRGIYAHCMALPHNVEFHLRISGQELLPAGYEPIKSPLILLAMQSE